MIIAGVDEAGRGPLAGPVVAAVVVLHPGQSIEGVRDSKQLSARRREVLFDVICAEAAEWSIAQASVAEIDQLNILQATMLAMRRAIIGLTVRVERLRIDGNRCPELPVEWQGIAETLVGGDAICPAIGAASILAKVSRDRLMLTMDGRFPEYGFAAHKGYPTAAHVAALELHGATPEHRRTFKPVRRVLQREGLEIMPAGIRR